MAIFQFRLAKLMELREHERTAARQALAVAQQQHDHLQARVVQLSVHRTAILDNIRRLSISGAIDVRALRAAHDHDARLKLEVAAEELRLAASDNEIGQRRQEVIAADQQVRILEKLRERQAERHRVAEHRRELRAAG